MSTDPSAPGTPGPIPGGDPVQPAQQPGATAVGGAPASGPTTGPAVGGIDRITDGSAPRGLDADGAGEPGWVTRHTSALIGVMAAVVVAALAIIGVGLYRHHLDERDSANEAAFRANVASQGATLETVECHGDTCAAIINNQAYSVLVQKDAKGTKHFGVSAFTGN